MERIFRRSENRFARIDRIVSGATIRFSAVRIGLAIGLLLKNSKVAREGSTGQRFWGSPIFWLINHMSVTVYLPVLPLGRYDPPI